MCYCRKEDVELGGPLAQQSFSYALIVKLTGRTEHEGFVMMSIKVIYEKNARLLVVKPEKAKIS